MEYNSTGTLSTPTTQAKSAYSPPIKRIHLPNDLQTFLSSATYKELVSFIVDLGEHVKGVSITKSVQDLINFDAECSITVPDALANDIPLSPPIVSLVNILMTLKDATRFFPPIQQSMRFGNKAFQNWWDFLKNRATPLLQEHLPEHLHPAICELEVYLLDSFGNRTRIDYGTGHELAFCQFLYCLFKLKFLGEEDKAHCVLTVFNFYVGVMRKLQTVYMLEPAGSRGVWGLDDYHFLPFLWGSSQLQDQDIIEPADINDVRIVQKYADAYLYLKAIEFILKTKKGVPFGECAPMLYDITSVPNWTKITSGLIKMYQAEVLQKFPVIQHVYFGSLIPFGG